MRRTKRTSLCLLLTSVGLLLAVLGMHVVAGGSHAPGVDHAAAAAPLAVDGVGTMHPTAVDAGAQHRVGFRLSGMPLPDAPGPAAAATALCVAVLVGLVSMLGVTRSRPAQPASAAALSPGQVLRRRAFTRAPPPDLLTRLCVLRT